MFVPAHHVEGSSEATRTAFVLHGILGSLRNWRTMARRIVARHPEWRLVLVDLRNHGDSGTAPPPHTLAACAGDLANLADQLGIWPEAVVGHSFGGKVALAYARDHGDRLVQVWVLDATPGAGEPEEAEVEQVIGALRSIPVPVARREQVAEALRARGFSDSMAQWMTTNLRPAEGGFVWRFDLDAIEEMIADYWRVDFFPFLARTALDVHVVRAEQSDRWTGEALAGFDRVSPTVHLHVLPDSGHWVHVDNPEGLLELLERGFGA